MSGCRPKARIELSALFDQERAIPAQSAAVRARALARARMALAIPRADDLMPAPPRFTPPLGRRSVAFALGVLVSASVGAAAYGLRARLAPRAKAGAGVPSLPIAAPPSPARSGDVPEEVDGAVLASLIDGPMLSRGHTAIAELRLLQCARDAIDRGDFGAALRPINEHARRFPNGWLSEEREALRVNALAETGRNEEARRAASAFRTRFPRSILGPAVSQMPSPESWSSRGTDRENPPNGKKP